MGSVAAAIALASLAAVGGATSAEAAASPWVGDTHSAVRLIVGAASPDATTLDAGLEFRFGPGWHGYWRTPGDAGVPPRFDWAGSVNVVDPVISWPAPARLVVEGLQNSIYTGDVVLPVTMRITDPHAAVSVKVSVSYAVCSEICVPRDAVLTLDAPPAPGLTSAEAQLIAESRARVPGPPSASGLRLESMQIVGDGAAQSLVVAVRSDAQPFEHPDLLVEGAGAGLPPPPTIDLTDGGRRVLLTVGLAGGERSPGDLTVTLVDGMRAAELSTARPPAAPKVRPGWVAALAAALLGGLILNLMPCVLPVLSIKLIGLTRHAATGPRAMRRSLVATALGVTASFVLLAVGLILLGWSGATLGWGIQFQQPWFLAAMATVTVLFAASFFEWLPIGLPRLVANIGGVGSRGPDAEAFMTGVLATLLATPCSAPFVGTAVGFALAQGPAEILAVFVCLGTGMAAPYWAAALVPDLVRYLPKPGPWMVWLRRGLGVLLLGTAVWLLVVLAAIAGPWVATTVAALLAALLGLRAWATSGQHRPIVGKLTAVLAIAPVLVSLVVLAPRGAASADDNWQVFDAAALPGLVAEGRTVLVDVTASWCLTCKVNELAALDRQPVRDRLAQAGTVRMRADWSRPDAAVAAYLNGFGRYGIPLDVVYGPGRPSGEALPELLTPDIVVQALDRATGGSSGPVPRPEPQMSLSSRKAS